MIASRFPIIIVGHVDHGKSTLIGRLLYDSGELSSDRYREVMKASSEAAQAAGATGPVAPTEFAFAMDVFEEERSRLMTMDVSYIYFKTRRRAYTVIDSPGHKELMKSMVTGATHAAAAVLVVDATEGAREQTARHISMLHLLRVQQVVVAVSKMDAVGYEREAFENTKTQMTTLLAESSITAAAYVPISAREGVNVVTRGEQLGWYSGPSLADALDSLKERSAEKRPTRFAVQDVYQIDGRRIIVGRVEAGVVRVGEKLDALSGKPTLVREIVRFGVSSPTDAVEGQCIGLVADDLKEIGRGSVLATPGTAKSRSVFEANLFWFEGKCESGETLLLKCATQDVPCTIELLKKSDGVDVDAWKNAPHDLLLGEIAVARITTAKPIVADAYTDIPATGRFAIEKQGELMGGGVIL